MKTPTKILYFALVLLVLFGLSGCYQASTTEETTDGEQVSYIGEEAAVPESGETAAEETQPSVVEETTAPASASGDINVFEGDLVQLNVKGTDPDGDAVTYAFSAPLDASGKWQTKVGDAGDYLVTVTASDGKTETQKTLKMKVMTRNSAPVMEKIGDMTVREGEAVSFDPKVLDPDGDVISVTYSGWMTSGSYTTSYNDAGEHVVTITASDSTLETSQNVKVTVTDVNRAPEFEIVVS